MAQNTQWLPKAEKENLSRIYAQRQIQSPGPYLNCYQWFINYMAFEKKQDAQSFFEAYEAFENKQNIKHFKLKYINLSLQKALLLWMQGDEFEGARCFYKAYRLFNSIESNTSNEYKKLEALFEIFLAQIPARHQFFASILGLRGDEAKGFKLMELYLELVNNDMGLYEEALVAHGYCLLKFGSPSTATISDYMNEAARHNSPLMAFIAASLGTKGRLGNETLSFCEALSPDHYTQFPLLHYCYGRMLINAHDPAGINQLEHYEQNYPGQTFKADASLRQAWWYHIQQQYPKRDKLISQVQQMTDLPSSNDKQAHKEAQKLQQQPQQLLQGRLFFDGGYYQKADSVLSLLDTQQLSLHNQANYNYRRGRVHQELQQYPLALDNFNKVIQLTQNDKRYIGPYAAIEAARIKLTQKDTLQAKAYLEQARQLNTGEYKQDITRVIADLIAE